MTRKEKQKLLKALEYLLEEENKGGDFQEGISILFGLLGIEGWYAKLKKSPVKSIKIQDLLLSSIFRKDEMDKEFKKRGRKKNESNSSNN